MDHGATKVASSSSKKRLSSSSSRKAEAIARRKRQRCESLMKDAHSHGAYLWRERDLRNALKWFESDQSSSSSTSSSSNMASMRDDFLRTLLCSRGILEYRPMKTDKQLSKEMFLAKHTPILKAVMLSMADDTQNAQADSTIQQENTAKQSDSTTDLQISENQSSKIIDEDSQTFLKNDDCHNLRDKTDQETTDVPWRRNRLLRENLQSIIQNRSITNQLYNLCSFMSEATFNVHSNGDSATNDKEQTQNHTLDGNDWHLFGSQHSNTQYFFHDSVKEATYFFSSPQTAVRKTYASQLCDRLVELQQQQFDSEKSIELYTQSSQDQVQNFIDKLKRLAENDKRIQETILFLLLESHNRKINIQRKSNMDDEIFDYNDPNEENQPPEIARSFSFIRKIVSCIIDLAPSKEMHEDHKKHFDKGIWGSPSHLLCSVCHSNMNLIADPYIKFLIISSINIQKQITNSIAKDVLLSSLKQDTSDNDNMDRANLALEHKLDNTKRLRLTCVYQDLILRLRNLCGSTVELRKLVHNLLETFEEWSDKDYQKKQSTLLWSQSKESRTNDNSSIFLSSIKDDLYSGLE